MSKGPIAVEEDFTVIDESNDWIVVSKAAPLIVHPTNNLGVEPTLIGGVRQLLAYEVVNGVKLSIINRLDRETSGIVVIAKHRAAARELCRAMERRLIEKRYSAIIFGWPDWDEVVVDEPILRKGEVEKSVIWVKQAVHPLGKASVTSFSVIERKEVGGVKLSLVSAYPKTGRMHQIRVHLSHLGFPIIGDKIYGENEECYLDFMKNGWGDRLERELLLPRQALHSSSFTLNFQGVEYLWEAKLAKDLISFWSGC